MAMTVHTAGITTVKIKIASDSSLPLSLGQTRNYAEVTKEAFFLDVPGDANGGDDGPPIEIQYLGEICRVRVELTKYDNTVANLVRARLNGGTAGTPGTAGSLMFAGTNIVRLVLDNANDPRNFNRAIPRMPIEIGRGTKYSTLICEFECHKDSAGLLYDNTTSGTPIPN